MSATPATSPAAKTLKDLILKPVFIMCDPTFFDPDKEAPTLEKKHEKPNDFAGKAKVDKELAMTQWQAFQDKIIELGGSVILAKPDEKLTGQIYTADPAAFHTNVVFAEDGKSVEQIHVRALRSKFTNADRQGELSAHFGAACEFTHSLRQAALGTGITISVTHENAAFNTEGSGDNVYDSYRGIWWSGYVPNPSDPKSGRSDIRAHAQLSNLMGHDVLSLQVMRPYFHIDTAVSPLRKGHVLCFASGMTAKSFDHMRKTALEDYGLSEDEYLIEVDANDANILACNLTSITDTDLIVGKALSDKLKDRLKQAGYTLHELDYSEALKGGGSFHCTANQVNITGPKGGTARDPDFYNRLGASL